MRKLVLLIAILVLTLNVLYLVERSPSQQQSYLHLVLGLLGGLITILAGCEAFANGVECVGRRLDLSHATAGGILAAVGTALPETAVPVIALVFGTPETRDHIAVGAILGAPFMLGTLAMFMLALSVVVDRFAGRRPEPILRVNSEALHREGLFFLLAMVGLIGISLLREHILNIAYACILVALYISFVHKTIRADSEDDEQYTETFYLNLLIGCPLRLRWALLQIGIGLLFIINGAHVFVQYLTAVSLKSGISPLILSLILTPVATELPEKFNSVTWTFKGKDTLGLANITGAMVFQSTIPVSVGLLFTEWHLSKLEFLNLILPAITMLLIFLYNRKARGRLPWWLLGLGGLFYGLYIYLALG